MVIDLATILVLGVISFFIAGSAKHGSSGWVNVVLVIALVISANIHGAFIGFGRIHLFISAILVGIFGGVLVKRLKPKTA